MVPAAGPTTPDDITATVVASFEAAGDERTRRLLQRLVEHLHAFVVETHLTEAEWAAAIEFLTETGHTCSASRQEFILLSDTLGISMLVDLLGHEGPATATESTVLGPFYLAGSPIQAMGTSIVRGDGYGEPTRISGRVLSPEGEPIGGATLDIWQNAANGKYAVQDPDQPEENLRGRFETGEDGAFSFWTVRPTDYPIPDDGPVGKMLHATGRHPWRPAHVHMRVSAAGFRPLTTHLFDDASRYLDSDTVFAVKSSLVCHFTEHDASEPGGEEAGDGSWFSLERDIVLAPEQRD